jgi:hypothetical protein
LPLRLADDLLFERGIDICHETVRFWWNRFGPMFAAEITKLASIIGYIRSGDGIWTRASTGRRITSGAPRIMKAKCSKLLPQCGGIVGPPSIFSNER